MTDRDPTTGEPRVHCRRLDRTLPLHEHADCPYCFGKPKAIATGEHEQFCDFRPGQDPVNFGFPPDTSRNRE